jgi:hypothetical protein
MEMMDRLVKLYELPALAPHLERLAAQGVQVRRPRAYEQSLVTGWVAKTFSRGWADECTICFARQPVSCFIATRAAQVIGFACHETTYRNFFGPIGVAEEARGLEVGSALLLANLHAMADLGYAYAIVGGPRDAAPFYRKVVNAIDIPGSDPGIYVDRLKGSDS